MSKSLLLKLARDSITEVFEATSIINREELLKDYPILNEPLACYINIYINNKLRGKSGSVITEKSLLEEIVFHAKSAAFLDADYTPLKVSDYINATLELSLITPLEKLNYTDISDIQKQVSQDNGLLISTPTSQAFLLPSNWFTYDTFDKFFSKLLKDAGINLEEKPDIYSFEVEKERDTPLVS